MSLMTCTRWSGVPASPGQGGGQCHRCGQRRSPPRRRLLSPLPGSCRPSPQRCCRAAATRFLTHCEEGSEGKAHSWCTYHAHFIGCEAKSQCGQCAPEHRTSIRISGGNLRVVACIDGAEGGVQRVAGAPPRQLYVSTCRGAKVRRCQLRQQGPCTTILRQAHLSP
jgi:hypothetical protein